MLRNLIKLLGAAALLIMAGIIYFTLEYFTRETIYKRSRL